MYVRTYEATIMGDYFLALKVDGEHIHESPFLVFIDHTGACICVCVYPCMYMYI